MPLELSCWKVCVVISLFVTAIELEVMFQWDPYFSGACDSKKEERIGGKFKSVTQVMTNENQ